MNKRVKSEIFHYNFFPKNRIVKEGGTHNNFFPKNRIVKEGGTHNNFFPKNRRGLSGIVVTLIIIGIALAAVGIVWYTINLVLEEQEGEIMSASSNVFSSCESAGYGRIEEGQDCVGTIKYMGGEKCCEGIVPDQISGLVGYWDCDEGSGQYLFDKSGNDQTGDAGSSLTFVEGRVGNAIVGNNNVEIIPSSDLYNAISNGDFSWSFWWTPNEEYDWADIISFDTNTGSNAVRFEHGNDVVSNFGYWGGMFDGSINQAIYHHTFIPDGERHHFVIIFDRTTNYIYVYIDGVLDSSAAKNLPIYTLVTKLTFFDASLLDDYLDEVRIYNRVLSEEEINALYLYP
ncbi:MAG: LamG domain-containing protein [archaeon]